MLVGLVVTSNEIATAVSQEDGFCIQVMSLPKIAACVLVVVVLIAVVPVPRAVVPSFEARNVNKQDVGLIMQYLNPDPVIVIVFALIFMMVLGVEWILTHSQDPSPVNGHSCE